MKQPLSSESLDPNRKILPGEKRVCSRQSTPSGAVLAPTNAHTREPVLGLPEAARGLPHAL